VVEAKFLSDYEHCWIDCNTAFTWWDDDDQGRHAGDDGWRSDLH
jgi:exonuclease III